MEKKRLNNEGFSLIELIIVIAIMAILVGALAPQLIKYLERSRQATDIQAVGALYTAVQTALADPVSNPKGEEVNVTLEASSSAYSYSGKTPAGVWKAVGTTLPDTSLKFTSDAYKDQKVTVKSENGGNLTIYLEAKSGSTGYDVEVNQNGSKVYSPGADATYSNGKQEGAAVTD